MSMQNKEALLTRVGKRILNIDGITLESVNSLRKEEKQRPYEHERSLRAVLFAAALANQVLPLMSADITEAYRRGKTVTMSEDYDSHSLHIDTLMYPISLVMGITASQFAHNNLVGLGIGLGVKGLANIVFGEVGRRMAKKAPNKIM